MIKDYKGTGALMVAFFFKKGRLASVKLIFHGGWHWKAARALVKQYGPPGPVNDAIGAKGVVGWKMDNGDLYYNKDPGVIPVMWTSTWWVARKSSRESKVSPKRKSVDC